MTREDVVRYLNSDPEPNTMMGVVQTYIYDMKQVNWNPTQVNIFQLQEAYEYAIMYYSKKFHVNILRNKSGNKILKIY